MITSFAKKKQKTKTNTDIPISNLLFVSFNFGVTNAQKVSQLSL